MITLYLATPSRCMLQSFIPLCSIKGFPLPSLTQIYKYEARHDIPGILLVASVDGPIHKKLRNLEPPLHPRKGN